jgi:glycosyltransferase involved in cell wall biosynthesis
MTNMRIAQVAPLGESVPPRKYGGTERIVSYLTEALVAQGHDVTLYAAGGSRSAAKLCVSYPRPLRELPGHPDVELIYRHVMSGVRAESHRYDIIHFHTGWFEFPHFTQADAPCLTTLHGRLNYPEMMQRLRAHSSFPLVSISESQRLPVPELNWLTTIYHGIPDPGLAPQGGGDYLVFLGRISPEKRPDLAIEIAQRAGLPVKLAAKVDQVDQEYFDTVIRPLLALPGVDFLGELDDAEKNRLLVGAKALIFPIDWPEPFGLAMIEAIACGTPVVAYRRGSVPEVLDDGVTGYIVEDVAGAVDALGRLDRLDRGAIRTTFLRRFSIARMVQDYTAVYDQLIERPADQRALSYGRNA